MQCNLRIFLGRGETKSLAFQTFGHRQLGLDAGEDGVLDEIGTCCSSELPQLNLCICTWSDDVNSAWIG